MLPLHSDAQQAEKNLSSHAGLWYDRFFNGFLSDAKQVEGEKEKAQWAANKTQWIKDNTSMVGDTTQLQAFNLRQQQLIQSQQGRSMIMSTDWHFVTGLGNNHPVENGFAWHPTLGVPYLTGAAVKGMVRAWCELWLGWKKEGGDDPRLLQWFGDTEQIGELIFFDAIPIRPVQVKGDIMTPHYGDWYAKGGEISNPVINEPEKLPADWHSPNPILFLAVNGGSSFSFAIAKRKPSDIDLEDAMATLTKALQWIGAGAKTGAGYGRFSENIAENERILLKKQQADAQAEAEAQAQRNRLAMSPFDKKLDEWLASDPEPATAVEWIHQLPSLTDDEQQSVAQTLKQYYERRGSWEKPSKKQKVNVQKVKRILAGKHPT